MSRYVAVQRDKDQRWIVVDLYLGEVAVVAPTDASNTEDAMEDLADRFEALLAVGGDPE